MLKLEGTRTLRIDENEQRVTLTGFVRAQDITPRNVVDSWRMADAELIYQSKGITRTRSKASSPHHRSALAMRTPFAAVALAALGLLASRPAGAQQVRIGDLAITDTDVPVRVMGYGLVVGLDGTGDRAIGGLARATRSNRS